MAFRVKLTPTAREQIAALEKSDPKRARKVFKTLGKLEIDPRDSGLHSHEYVSLKGPNGEKIWESYVENNTPAAFRVFWFYGPEDQALTVFAITPHP